MDIYFDLKSFSSESIHACIAAGGKVDRLLYKFNGNSFPSENILKFNAGASDNIDPRSRDAMIANGTLEWLQDFHEGPTAFILSNTAVKSLHRKIFKYSSRDDGARGRYRTDLDDDLKDLFDEIKKALRSDDYQPLFVISLFRLFFIDMMPFITGNAQTANILSYVLLFNAGYTIVSQLPLIASLNNTNGVASHDPLPLLARTLYSLMSSHQPSTPTLRTSQSYVYINPRRQSLINCISKNAPLKISDIMTFFPTESRNTVKKDLLFLRENGLVLSNGEGRGMVYFVSHDV